MYPGTCVVPWIPACIDVYIMYHGIIFFLLYYLEEIKIYNIFIFQKKIEHTTTRWASGTDSSEKTFYISISDSVSESSDGRLTQSMSKSESS